MKGPFVPGTWWLGTAPPPASSRKWAGAGRAPLSQRTKAVCAQRQPAAPSAGRHPAPRATAPQGTPVSGAGHPPTRDPGRVPLRVQVGVCVCVRASRCVCVDTCVCMGMLLHKSVCVCHVDLCTHMCVATCGYRAASPRQWPRGPCSTYSSPAALTRLLAVHKALVPSLIHQTMHWGQWAAVGTSAGTGDGQERSPRGSRWRMWPGLSQWSWSGDSGDRSTGRRGGSKGAAWGTATRGSQAGPSPTDVDTRPAWLVSAEEMGSVQTRKRPWPSQAALPTRGL